jgi:predicted DNA-binding transcriptional regulator AlpA
MALVKLRSWNTKPEQSTAKSPNGAKVEPPRSVSKPRGLHFTMETSYAAFLKERSTAPGEPAEAVQPTVPVQAPAKNSPKSKQPTDGDVPRARKARRKADRPLVDLDRPGYLRLVDVLTVFPVSRAKWYMGIESGIYPKSHPLGLRARGWKTADIKALVDGVLTKPVAAN